MSPRRVATWVRSHPAAADAALAALLAAVAVPDLSLGRPAGTRGLDVGAVLLVVAVVAPLLARRRRPDLVLVACGTASLAADAANYAWAFAWPALVVAVYSYARRRARRTDCWAAIVWLAEIGLHLPLASTRHDPGSLAGILALSAGAWIVGDGLRTRSIERRRLLARAEQAEHEREVRARAAVAAERARIARELHDVVAHALGVVVMQSAGAGRKHDLDLAQARDSLASIETTARDAFGEMRRLVAVLRDEGATPELAPQPTAADIPALVANLRRAGLDVSLACAGRPGALPSGAELSAYRVVQEALTNALEHAPGASARVELRWSADGLDIDVGNDPPKARRDASPRPAPGARAGHGLVGMRERTALFGGCFRAGPRADGGFAVHATFPAGRPS